PYLAPLSLHDALPICSRSWAAVSGMAADIRNFRTRPKLLTSAATVNAAAPAIVRRNCLRFAMTPPHPAAGKPSIVTQARKKDSRSEEHTSELQSPDHL